MAQRRVGHLTRKYLLDISYIGTKYAGVQRQACRSILETTENTVQCSVEAALRRLHPLHGVSTTISSRTDAGVHALHNCMSVSLTHPDPGTVYQPGVITYIANDYLRSSGHEITVTNTTMVPMDFNLHLYALSRTYIYRLAILRPEYKNHLLEKGQSISSLVPIIELYRCNPIKMPDFEIIHQATQLFRGEHDFISFMTRNSDNLDLETAPRIVYDCQLKKNFEGPTLAHIDPLYRYFDFYDFYVHGKSFLYNQIRKMVGATLGAGYGTISINRIKAMLDNPKENDWPRDRLLLMAPPHGLWLAKVEIDQEAILFNESSDKTEQTNENQIIDYRNVPDEEEVDIGEESNKV